MGGKTSAKSKNTWISKTYDRINLTVPKGQKENIQAHAEAHGESVNGFIGRAIYEAMERDSGAVPSPDAPERATAPASPSGGISLSPQTEKAAQSAAEATGESVPEYLARAVSDTAKRDQTALKLGIDPVTGKPLERDILQSEQKEAV